MLPLDKNTLQRLNKDLYQAWIRIEKYLDWYAISGDAVQQYIINLLRRAVPITLLHDMQLYTRVARASMPYMVNLLIISGPPGSGKSTLLASLAADARRKLYQAIFANPPDRLHVILDMIDVTLIPSTDTILNWLFTTLHALISEIYAYINNARASSNVIQVWQELKEEAEELMNNASRVNLDPASLIRISGDLDEYGVFAADALQSGYSIPLRYVTLAQKVREELQRLCGCEPGVIAYILDDLDALEPPRLLEAILSCKLVSLEPHTLCIVSVKDKTLLASRIVEYVERMLRAHSVHRILHTIDIAYVVEKLVFNAPVVMLPAPSVGQAVNHIPPNLSVLGNALQQGSEKQAQRAPTLQDLANLIHFETLRRTLADQKLTLARLLFDNFPEQLGYENFYGKNLQILRCLDRLYILLYQLTDGGKNTYYLSMGKDLKEILEILSTCTIESEYAAALGFDVQVLTEGVYTQSICAEKLYTELFSVQDPKGGAIPLSYNIDAASPRLVTLGSKRYSKASRCKRKGAYGGRTGWFQERYAALAGLMRDLAYLVGLPATTLYDHEYHIFALGGYQLPLIKFESLEYLAKLLVILNKLAVTIRSRVLNGTFYPLIDPTTTRGAAQLLYFLLNYIAANMAVAAYAAAYACLTRVEDAEKKLTNVLKKLLNAELHAYESHIEVFVDVLYGNVAGKEIPVTSEIVSHAYDAEWFYRKLYRELADKYSATLHGALEETKARCKKEGKEGCAEIAEALKELADLISYEMVMKRNLPSTHAFSGSPLLEFIESMARLVAGLESEHGRNPLINLKPEARALVLALLAALRGGPV